MKTRRRKTIKNRTRKKQIKNRQLRKRRTKKKGGSFPFFRKKQSLEQEAATAMLQKIKEIKKQKSIQYIKDIKKIEGIENINLHNFLKSFLNKIKIKKFNKFDYLFIFLLLMYNYFKDDSNDDVEKILNLIYLNIEKAYLEHVKKLPNLQSIIKTFEPKKDKIIDFFKNNLTKGTDQEIFKDVELFIMLNLGSPIGLFFDDDIKNIRDMTESDDFKESIYSVIVNNETRVRLGFFEQALHGKIEKSYDIDEKTGNRIPKKDFNTSFTPDEKESTLDKIKRFKEKHTENNWNLPMMYYKTNSEYDSEYSIYYQNALTKDHFDKIIEWANIGSKQKRFVIFDWDKTITLFQEFIPDLIKSKIKNNKKVEKKLYTYNYSVSTLPSTNFYEKLVEILLEKENEYINQEVLFYLGGKERLKYIKDMINKLFEKDIGVYILTSNENCRSHKDYFERFLQNINEKFNKNHIICSMDYKTKPRALKYKHLFERMAAYDMYDRINKIYENKDINNIEDIKEGLYDDIDIYNTLIFFFNIFKESNATKNLYLLFMFLVFLNHTKQDENERKKYYDSFFNTSNSEENISNSKENTSNSEELKHIIAVIYNQNNNSLQNLKLLMKKINEEILESLPFIIWNRLFDDNENLKNNKNIDKESATEFLNNLFGELEKNSINIKTNKEYIEKNKGYKENVWYLNLQTFKVCLSFIYEVLKLLKLDVSDLLSKYFTKDYRSKHLPPSN